MFLERPAILLEWSAGLHGQMEFCFSPALKRAVCVDMEFCLSLPQPSSLNGAGEYVSSPYKCTRRLQTQRGLCPLERGTGRLEGPPPPLVIARLFCFASLVIGIRICWNWRLSMTRTCRVNRMSKKHIVLSVSILKCPRLCYFQRRTPMNCKPWLMQEGTCNNVSWRGKWNVAENLGKAQKT